MGNRGSALWALKLHDAALESFDRALALQADFAFAHYNRALVLSDMKRHDEALAGYDAALALAPDFGEAWSSRGLTLYDLGRQAESVESYDKALALRVDPETLTNRGLALWELGRPQEAIDSYDRALALQPGFVPALNNRAMALTNLNRPAEALASYERLVAVQSNNADAWLRRGNVLRRLGRNQDAVISYNTALAIRPDYAEALHNRAHTLWSDLEEYKAAVWDYERVLEIDPDHPHSRGELLHVRMYGGDWKDYDRQVALIDDGVRAGRPVVQPFIYQAIAHSPADLQACSRIFARNGYPAVESPLRPSLGRGPATGTRKIRIGYVSSDFREQATSYLMAGLYEQHDKDRFEIVAFDNGYDDKSPECGRGWKRRSTNSSTFRKWPTRKRRRR